MRRSHCEYAAVHVILIAIVVTCVAETKETFTPDATVTLANDTKVDLANFALLTAHLKPVGFYYYFEAVKEQEVMLPIDHGGFWTQHALTEIASLSLLPDPKSTAWRLARLRLVSGTDILGRVPTVPMFTWYSGDDFAISGFRQIIGKTGRFRTSLRNITNITRDERDPSTSILVTKEGTPYRLADVVLETIDVVPDFQPERYTRGDSSVAMRVRMDRTEVSVQLKDLINMEFKETQYSRDVRAMLRMKDGQEVVAELINVTRIYGETKDGRIWFTKLYKDREYVLRSVKFRQ